jgi:Fic family protein
MYENKTDRRRTAQITIHRIAVLAALPGKPKTSREVAAIAGVTEPTATKYLLEAVGNGGARITNKNDQSPRRFGAGYGGKPARLFQEVV